MLSRASLSFPLPRNPSQISLFLCSFSSLEAPLTARKVCSQPHVDLGILGPCVCYGYTPAAAMAHVHVWILCEQTCHLPMCPPPQRGPAGVRGFPGMSRLPKASAGTGPAIQEVAMATDGPSCHLLQSVLGPGHPLGFLEICSL